MAGAPETIEFVTAKQARRIDQTAQERWGIPSLVLMENAARGCAEWIVLHLSPQRVAIAVGPGNNGGDGLAIARHLSIAGVKVHVVLAVAPTRLRGDARINWEINLRLGLPWMELPAGESAAEVACIAEFDRWAPDIVVDALLGTGADQPPRGTVAGAIRALLACRRPVVAVDVPSGWNAQTGVPMTPCVRAAHTLTMVTPKNGFQMHECRACVGQWHVIAIGFPVALMPLALADNEIVPDLSNQVAARGAAADKP